MSDGDAHVPLSCGGQHPVRDTLAMSIKNLLIMVLIHRVAILV